jgi:hypothetical protein
MFATPIDVLLVINRLNQEVTDHSQFSPEGESSTMLLPFVQDTTNVRVMPQSPQPDLTGTILEADRPTPSRAAVESDASTERLQDIWSDVADYTWLDAEVEAAMSEVAGDVFSNWRA